ncbi:MAG: lipoate protein ligase C-terminal domain-containing protein [Caldisphaera sp.]|jgi:hypothetical protein|nr:lipoate protein ligase C-terminal domain-containing protein [Caldisphaera sp.]PMP60465.1 MAG: lipoate--protein ligase [Caldisphaera sp.]PMP90481.1 MAG: lipoate--protein ligase [Caldisphaera sp.]
MGECEVKAKKGLIRVIAKKDDNKIKNISITGDFMVFPEDVIWELEKKLIGVNSRKEDIRNVLNEILKNANLLGSTIDDFLDVIMCSLEA